MDDMARFRLGVTTWARSGRGAATPAAVAELAPSVSTVVLVEGDSDLVAIETLARTRGRSLADERIAIVPLGGAMNIRTFVTLLGPHGLGLGLAGLCDIGEERFFARALADAGLLDAPGRSAMEDLGFFVCDADLEDELIRTLGTDDVELTMAAEGDLRAFRVFQNQPAQRARAVDAQQRRFLGSIGGRKSRYARALVEALGDAPAPRPLERLLEFVATPV
ncbi:MAG: TOPRIM nucleotidyl transferase/hydrolase domain-containing protein [Mycetocola sp.]